MRAAGIDVDWWRRAKMIETVFGPMAEARFMGRPFEELWGDYSAEGDVKDAVRFGVLCGLKTEAIHAEIADSISITEQHIERPPVWLAVTALANHIKPGRTPGRIAAQIVMRALARSAA